MDVLTAEAERPKLVAGQCWPKQLWLLVLPVGFLILHGLFLEARGPFWTRPSVDPDYPYLFNSLNVATKKAPHHIDHPGTTLQVWGAFVLKAAHPFSSGQTLAEQVLREPERHLRWINGSLAVLYSLLLLGSGAWVWRKTGERLPSLILQSTPFFLGSFFGITTRVSPEPVLLIAGILLATLLYLHSRQDESGTSLSAALGAVIAMGIVTKLNFVPLAIMPFICLRGWKQRAVFTASVAFFTACWLMPVAAEIGHMAQWALRLAMAQQQYGTGKLGFLPGSYASNLAALLTKHSWITATVALSGVAVLLSLALGLRQTPQVARWRRLLTALACGQTLQLALIAKYAQSRYLVPTAMLCPLNLLLLWHFVERQSQDRRWWHSARTGTAVAGCIVVTIISLSLRTHYVALSRVTAGRAQIAEKTQEGFNHETIVLIGVASSSYYALWFGNFWAGAHYTPLLRDRILPNHRPVYLLEGDNYVWLSGARLMPLSQFAAEHRSFVLSGNARHERRIAAQLPAGSKIERLEARSGEAIYRVSAGHTPPQ